MGFADNFNPEWGYIAPAPSFLRMARIVAAAAAIGASAGGAVVFSLVGQPADTMSVAARTLPKPDPATEERTSSQAGHLAGHERPQSPLSRQATPALGHEAAAQAAAISSVVRPAGTATLAEAPPISDAAPAPDATIAEVKTAAAPEAPPAQRKVVRSQRSAAQYVATQHFAAQHSAPRYPAWRSAYRGQSPYGNEHEPLALMPSAAGSNVAGYSTRGED